MKNLIFTYLLLFLLLVTLQLKAGNFPLYFSDNGLRVDLYHSGDARNEFYTVDRCLQTPFWAGNPNHMLDENGYGKYQVCLFDVASNRLIFSRSFNSYFGEYQTTDPAIQGVTRTYQESLLLPAPKSKFRMQILKRDSLNIYFPIFTTTIDPADITILKQNTCSPEVKEIHGSGEYADRADILFISEGYTEEQKADFWEDAQKMADKLLSIEPYASLKSKLNIRAAFLPSPESGTDEPRKGQFRLTNLESSFNALGLERYLLTEQYHRLADVCSAVPCDAPVILVNSQRYGGGGIYNYYAITTADHPLSPMVFLHEFGHSFAGLADEYYNSEVAYNDFYPKGIEPVEPNITRLLNPQWVKWQKLLSPDVMVPTDWGKQIYDELGAKISKLHAEMREQVKKLEAKGKSAEKIEAVRQKYRKKLQKVYQQRKEFIQDHELKDKVGVFEGAGYVSEGIYRPMLSCIMFSNDRGEFCKVCQDAIRRTIEQYSEGEQGRSE
ncbi:MAG: hypothetical protein Kow0037_21210 [Calditrichia bacterium]